MKKGDILAEWDPYAKPIIADLSSVVHFQDIEEGVTMSNKWTRVTGFSTKVITDSKGADSKPAILLKDANGQQLTFPGRDLPVRYVIPVGAQLLVSDGQEVHAGDVIAKIHRESHKNPRHHGVYLELRNCLRHVSRKKQPSFSEFDGFVTFGGCEGQTARDYHPRSGRTERVLDSQRQARCRS